MAPLISKKATVHRLKAYNAFSVGTGHSLDELVLSPAELEQGATSAWLWLVNLNLGAGMNTATDSVEDALEGIEGVGEIVEWLAKPYVLVQVGSDARPALEHLRARKPSSARPVLYVELARPQVVATLLATLAPSSTPISQTDEVYGLHKRWDDGLILIEDFVTEKEERMIMEGILAEDGWHADTTKRQSRHAGPVFDYSTFAANDECRPIPSYLAPYLPRLPRLPNEPISDQLTVQYYPPGTGIPPHVDTHSAFGESLYSLSLASSVSMTLVECGPEQARRLRLPKRSLSSAPPPPPSPTPSSTSFPPTTTLTISLPPRSLLIMTSASRYGWTHAIAPRRADQVGNRVVPREAKGRYSVTFRSVRRGVECECGWPEYCDSRIRKEVEAGGVGV